MVGLPLSLSLAPAGPITPGSWGGSSPADATCPKSGFQPLLGPAASRAVGGGPTACGHRHASSGGPWQSRGLGCCSRSSPAGAPGRAPCRLLASRCAGSATGRAAGRLFSLMGGHTSMEADSRCSCCSGQGCVRERACGFPPEGRVQSDTVSRTSESFPPLPTLRPREPAGTVRPGLRPSAVDPSPRGRALAMEALGMGESQGGKKSEPWPVSAGSTVTALSGSVHDGLALMHRGPCCPTRPSLGCWRSPQSLN